MNQAINNWLNNQVNLTFVRYLIRSNRLSEIYILELIQAPNSECV